MSLYQIFQEALEQRASDIHFTDGSPICLRIEGRLVPVTDANWDRAALEDLLEPMLTSSGLMRIEAGLPFERTLVHNDHAFVGIVYRCGIDGIGGTFRILPSEVPALSTVAEGAEPMFERVVAMVRGLVLMFGPNESGKTTSLMAGLEAINESRAARIFVVAAHPCFTMPGKLSMVTMLHVGHDCDSYERALSLAEMSDLDIVALDDIPNPEVLRQMLFLSETGHLVVANLHADSVVDGIQRLLGAIGQDADLRRSLARNLTLTTSQRLLRRCDRKGRVAAYEWLDSSVSVREAILAGDIARLSELQASDQNSRSLDSALDDLLERKVVSEEAASALRSA